MAPGLSDWASFYVIVGSSSGALTGLQFVVMALIQDVRSDMTPDVALVSAFGTPTVIHFCSALLVSAILSAPWTVLSHAGVAVGLCGLTGAAYVLVVAQRARRQTTYQPVLEDWIWHTILPLASYVMMLVGGLLIPTASTGAMFGIAAASLLLLFIGIHNAWDTVVYVAVEQRQKRSEAANAGAARDD